MCTAGHDTSPPVPVVAVVEVDVLDLPDGAGDVVEVAVSVVAVVDPVVGVCAVAYPGPEAVTTANAVNSEMSL